MEIKIGCPIVYNGRDFVVTSVTMNDDVNGQAMTISAYDPTSADHHQRRMIEMEKMDDVQKKLFEFVKGFLDKGGNPFTGGDFM